MGKSISIVTGGAGFIGSHMVDLLLSKGHTVRIIDNFTGGWEKNIEHHRSNKNLHVYNQDIRSLDPESKIFLGAHYVFHFAGIGDIVPSIENPSEYMDVNIQGTVRVLECARRQKIKKILYASSSSCYGLAPVPTTEKAPIRTEYPYALSKYLGEQSVFHWHKVYGVPANAIRIFNCYGPRVRTTGVYGAVFGVFFKQKLAGKPFTIVGDGTQKRDFLFVTDIVKAFYLAATTPLEGQVWNLGAGNPQSVNALVDLIEGEKTFIPKRPGEPDCTWADISKIQKDLNWKPEVSFECGVKEMLKDIDRWKDAPLWDKDSIKTATKTWFEYLGK
ncbi:GDP-mannose 4,6-dehydratase [Alphaproteobacteria bacterium]|nr:GDP-mannose 4,6-dehydratase [Alphaproteobacteria bacterium]